jgi:hypothetical protein
MCLRHWTTWLGFTHQRPAVRYRSNFPKSLKAERAVEDVVTTRCESVEMARGSMTNFLLVSNALRHLARQQKSADVRLVIANSSAFLGRDHRAGAARRLQGASGNPAVDRGVLDVRPRLLVAAYNLARVQLDKRVPRRVAGNPLAVVGHILKESFR